MPSSALPWYVKGILYVGIPSACLAALYLSIPGEIALAKTAGWSDQFAPAMPVCLSVYAIAAGAIAALRRKMQMPGQTTALVGSVMALLLTMSAQSISHLIAQGYMETSALLVVAISCIPGLTIIHLVHMAETPSQAKTADEKMGEFRDMVDFLSLQLLDSQTAEAATVIAHTAAVTSQAAALTQIAATVTEGARDAAEELDRALTARTRRGRVQTVTGDMVEAAARKLKEQNERVTGTAIAEALGLSESSFYRLPKEVRAAAV
ncbi:hypothetical protein ACFC1D_05200 [Streptomyces vinaceus]|uniref:hypothetical protein n=1 Tax=Streptomyces vinaceus TaxID=1960 RepID=UPI0035E32B81